MQDNRILMIKTLVSIDFKLGIVVMLVVLRCKYTAPPLNYKKLNHFFKPVIRYLVSEGCYSGYQSLFRYLPAERGHTLVFRTVEYQLVIKCSVETRPKKACVSTLYLKCCLIISELQNVPWPRPANAHIGVL